MCAAPRDLPTVKVDVAGGREQADEVSFDVSFDALAAH